MKMSSVPSALKERQYVVVNGRTRVMGILPPYTPYFMEWDCYVTTSSDSANSVFQMPGAWASVPFKVKRDAPKGYAGQAWFVAELEDVENEFGPVSP